MKYKPDRDIPKAVRELKTVSPTKIAQWIQDHRTVTDATGKRRQTQITSQAISMYFKRHPKLETQLKAEVEEEQLTQGILDERIFENGTFQKLPCIQRWINKMRGRGAKLKSGFITAIKQVCLGQLPRSKQQIRNKEAPKFIEAWGIKHPARLTLEDAFNYIAQVEDRKLYSRRHRLALRNFLKSRNVPDADDISGRLEEDAGKYATLKCSEEKVYEIFAWLKPINYTAYLASWFGYSTACRLGATLSAVSSDLTDEETIWVWEKATLHEPKRRLEKALPHDLYLELKKRQGTLFNIQPQELNGLLRSAYQAVIPEIAERIPMPFHFMRHLFAQHMLDKTKREKGVRDYALVAKLGDWKPQTLEKYYGGMEKRKAIEEGRDYLPNGK